MTDMLSFRDAEGVTRAAQTPQARRKEGEEGGGGITHQARPEAP